MVQCNQAFVFELIFICQEFEFNPNSVAFSGDWKKVSTTGAEEFFAAHEVKPENVEKLKKSALAEMITHMKDNGSSLTFSRTLTLDG